MSFDLSTTTVIRCLHEHEVRFVLCTSGDQEKAEYTVVYENDDLNVQALTEAMNELGAKTARGSAALSIAGSMIRNSPALVVMAQGREWSLARGFGDQDYDAARATADSVIIAAPFFTLVL